MRRSSAFLALPVVFAVACGEEAVVGPEPDGIPQIRANVVSSNTKLTEDHVGPIVITADKVKLNCAGHAVIGSGEVAGILMVDRTGVTVRNCHVHGFQNGFDVFQGSGNKLLNNVATDNIENGFRISDSPDNTIKGNSANRNRRGFVLIGTSEFNTLTGNSASDNGLSGFLSDSDDNTYTNNRASDNGSAGFAEFGGGGFNTYTRNTAVGNQDGFFLDGPSHDNTLENNVASQNTRSGFILGDDFVVSNNQASRNGNNGFVLFGVSGNTLTWNTAIKNGFEGFELRSDASNNTLINNEASRNGRDGFFIGFNPALMPPFTEFPPNLNVLTGNTANNNRRNGILVSLGSFDNTLTENAACKNKLLDAEETNAFGVNDWMNNVFCTSIGIF